MLAIGQHPAAVEEGKAITDQAGMHIVMGDEDNGDIVHVTDLTDRAQDFQLLFLAKRRSRLIKISTLAPK